MNAEIRPGYIVHWLSIYGRENDTFESLSDAVLYQKIVGGTVYDGATGEKLAMEGGKA